MKKSNLFIFVLALFTLLVFFIGLNIGSASSNVLSLWNGDAFDKTVVFELRMPRLILAWLVGALLAVAGSIMQRVLNNPLADPYILGSAAGASFGVMSTYLLLGAGLVFYPSIGAFIGAFGSILLILSISKWMGQRGQNQIILAGVAVSSFLMALLSFIIYMYAGNDTLKSLVYWSFGSFELANWTSIVMLLPLLVLTLVLQPLWHKQMGLMLLGDTRVMQLGENPTTLRWRAMLFSSLLVAFCVAQAGPIGFVGLMVPHWVRGIFGMHRLAVVWELLIGGFLLLLAEVIGRLLIYPAGLPPGIITAMMGVPFFVYLLVRKKHNFQ